MKKHLFVFFLLALAVFSCKKDDDDEIKVDPKEQALIDDAHLQIPYNNIN